MSAALWEIEDGLHAEGYKVICGVDEAGRGPLAGPVCAAAVILPRDARLEGLNDSKMLSAKRRELNILNATYLAMNRAISAMGADIDLALIDGDRASGVEFPNRTVVKGDAKCASIAAASILAKVTRDRYMCDLAAEYPEYGFEKHKGYGTKEHYAAIREYGPCPEHRVKFLRKMH